MHVINVLGTIVAYGRLNDRDKRPPKGVADLSKFLNCIGGIGNLYLVKSELESKGNTRSHLLFGGPKEDVCI